MLPTFFSIQVAHVVDRAGEFGRVLTHEPCSSIVHYLEHGTLGQCNDRRATCHRLQQHEAERLLPTYWEDQATGAGQQVELLRPADFANPFDTVTKLGNDL